MLHTLLQDLRFAVRVLSRNPGTTAVAVLILALGIGANTSIFSIIDPLLLQQLPVYHPDELVRLDAAGSLGNIGMWEMFAYERLRDQSPAFSGVLFFSWFQFDGVMHDGRSGSVQAEVVSKNFFDVLGLPPYSGRLTYSDQELGNTAAISFDYWRREFGGDPAAIGKSLIVQGKELTIKGITPPGFIGLRVGESADIYIPSQARANAFAPEWVIAIGRLKPGVSPEQGITQTAPLLEQIRKETPLPVIEQRQEMDHLVFSPAARGLSSVRAQFRLPAQILLAVSALVLLIACANVANLLLAQGVSRRREIAVRLAMGAHRRRIVRQLVTEGSVLALAGTAGGLIAARWTSAVIVAALSDVQTHVVLATPLSGRVLFFTLACSVITVLLCGVFPALSATRIEITQDIKEGGSASSRRSAGMLGRALVVGQVAMSVTALAAGGMLLHSLVNLETTDTGYERDHVVAVDMSADAAGYTPQQVRNFYDRLIAEAQSLPGVRSAVISGFAPVSGRAIGVNVRVDGYAAPKGEEPKAFMVPVTPGYLNTLGIPLLQGRDFTLTRDLPNTPRAALINRSLARHYFATSDPIGKRLEFVEGGQSVEIIGVVADTKYHDLRETPADLVYMDMFQSRQQQPMVLATLSVRAAGSPESLHTELPKLIRSLDSSVRTARIETLRERIDDSLHTDRLIAALCGGYSALALVLTGAGLYGVLAFSVSRRTQEIGIRMALGAGRRSVLKMVVGQAMRLVAAGLAIGLVAGLAGTALLQRMLFGVRPGDPVTFISISLLLAGVSALACYLPARRATRVDPLIALRNE